MNIGKHIFIKIYQYCKDRKPQLSIKLYTIIVSFMYDCHEIYYEL